MDDLGVPLFLGNLHMGNNCNIYIYIFISTAFHYTYVYTHVYLYIYIYIDMWVNCISPINTAFHPYLVNSPGTPQPG